jgi:hypothetical protein
MLNWEFYSLQFLGTVLDESDCQIFFVAVTEVNIGPNTLDIAVRNQLIDVRIFRFIIQGDECVSVLPNPDRKQSVS